MLQSQTSQPRVVAKPRLQPAQLNPSGQRGNNKGHPLSSNIKGSTVRNAKKVLFKNVPSKSSTNIGKLYEGNGNKLQQQDHNPKRKSNPAAQQREQKRIIDLDLEDRSQPMNTTISTTMSDLSVYESHTCGIVEHRGNTTAVRRFRIIVSSNSQYLDVFMNWLVYYYDVCPNVAYIYFICLDSSVERQLHRFGLSCAHVHHLPKAGGNHRLWLIRARITKALLDQNYDVLLSDSDAIWLRNPFLLFEQYPQSQIISSRASFPEDSTKRHGASLCMGFIYIKSTPLTRAVWSLLVAVMSKDRTPDDQRQVNHLFGRLKLKYDVRPGYASNRVENHGHIMQNGQQVNITLMPHHLVRRICDHGNLHAVYSSVVAHCLTHQKKGQSKASAQMNFGTWALTDSWQNVAFNHSRGMDHFMQRITSKRNDRVVSRLAPDTMLRLDLYNQTAPAVRTPQNGAIDPPATAKGVTLEGPENKTSAISGLPVDSTPVPSETAGTNEDIYLLQALIQNGTDPTQNNETALAIQDTALIDSALKSAEFVATKDKNSSSGKY